jgi:hypothetical protein
MGFSLLSSSSARYSSHSTFVPGKLPVQSLHVSFRMRLQQATQQQAMQGHSANRLATEYCQHDGMIKAPTLVMSARVGR